VHWLQHVCFLTTALIFWSALLREKARERGYGAAVLYMFVTTLHTALLGIVLTLARRPIYPLQTQTSLSRGLSSLEDQQLAGFIMWMPAGLIYAIAALALAAAWIASAKPRHGLPKAYKISTTMPVP